MHPFRHFGTWLKTILPITGVVVTGVVATILWFVWDEWGPSNGARYVPYLILAIVIGIAFAAASFIAWREQYEKAESYRKSLEPKFAIAFEPTDDDSGLYLDSKSFIQTREGYTPRRMRIRKYRIGIVNLSKAIVPGVHAVIERCSPRGIDQPVVVGAKLQVMDTEPAVGDADLHPHHDQRPTLYFDVVRELGKEDSGTPQEMGFCYAVSSHPRHTKRSMHDPEYLFRFTIRVSGGGYSCEREFIVEKAIEQRDGTYQYKRLEMRPA